jgi:hypothetical protein
MVDPTFFQIVFLTMRKWKICHYFPHCKLVVQICFAGYVSRDTNLLYRFPRLYRQLLQNQEEGGSRQNFPRPGGPEGRPGPDYVAYVFVFLDSTITYRLYKLTPSEQARHSATVSLSFQFCVNIFSWSAPCWETRNKIFYRAQTRSWRP